MSTNPMLAANSVPRGNLVTDYFSFRYMVTPGLIGVIYLLGAVIITAVAIWVLIEGPLNVTGAPLPPSAPTGRLGAVVLLVVGNVAWRVICEFYMVAFRIHDAITSLDRKTAGQ